MNELIISPKKLIHKIQVYIFIIFSVMLVFNYFTIISITLNNMSITQLVISIGVFAVLMFTCTIVHEFSHYVTAKLLKHSCKVHLSKKFIEFYGDLPRKDFILIAISPLLVHIIQILFFVYYFPYNILFSSIFALMSIVGCMSDGYFIYKVLRFDSNTIVFRFKKRGIFEVIPLD